MLRLAVWRGTCAAVAALICASAAIGSAGRRPPDCLPPTAGGCGAGSGRSRRRRGRAGSGGRVVRGLPQRPRQGRRAVAARLPGRARRPARRHHREDDPQAARRADAAGRQPPARRRRARRPGRRARRRRPTPRAGEAAPGRRTFQRLNRAEYARSVHDLLGLDVNAGDYLPLDTKSANFDNIADAQLLSPTLMQAYLTAAAEISRLAVGDRARDGARSHLSGVALDLAARAGRGRAVRHARRAVGRAHVPGRRRVSLPRVVLSRDDRRAVRQRPRGAAHRRGARAGRDLDRRRARRAARRRPLDEQRPIPTA